MAGNTKIRIRREIAHPRHVQFGQRLSEVDVPTGLSDYDTLFDEILDMLHIMQGKADSPVISPYLSLMEVATAYIARGFEIEMLILQLEHQGDHSLQKFRTGPLRSFIDAARKMVDLGSRRLSQETLLSEMRRDSGER